MTMVNTQDVTYLAALFKTMSHPLARKSLKYGYCADNQALNDRTATETKTSSKVCDHTICNAIHDD